MTTSRTIAIEEHFGYPAAMEAASSDLVSVHQGEEVRSRLEDLGAGRLAEMDASGIDVQVISHTTPGPDSLGPSEAGPLAREANDVLGEAVAAHPDRFAGFAALPMPDPEAAADELERTVESLGFKGAMINGLTDGRFLDDALFRPVLERAEALDVPLYLHPDEPPDAVARVYFGGLPSAVGRILATAGWGWHAENGLHALRMILAGVSTASPGSK